METGVRVQNKETGKVGHVINDSFRCCSDNEIMVVYEGTTCGSGTDRELLSKVEQTKPVPNFHKCGGGRGADCCIFLVVSGKGFECERFTSLRDTLIFRSMHAERNPAAPYPDCMKFPEKGEEDGQNTT